MPNMPAARPLEDGQSLLTVGFSQIFKTAKHINSEYRHGLRWFLLAVLFSEAAANALVIVSVVYLNEHIGFSGAQIGIFFLITLIAGLPGAVVATKVTGLLDPKRSWQLAAASLTIWTAGGAILMDLLPQFAAYLWGAGFGLNLGW